MRVAYPRVPRSSRGDRIYVVYPIIAQLEEHGTVNVLFFFFIA